MKPSHLLILLMVFTALMGLYLFEDGAFASREVLLAYPWKKILSNYLGIVAIITIIWKIVRARTQ